jgi:glucokinase
MARVLGIDFGGTKILVGVIDTESGEVVSSAKKRTVAEHGHGEALAHLQDAVRESLDGAGIGTRDVSSVGIGIAGQVDSARNELTRAPNLSQALLGRVIVDSVRKEVPVDTMLYNDVAAAAAGEAAFGAGRGHPDFVCIFVGTGIGGAIYRNGAPYLGATNTAGELGHMVVDFNGRICGCGGRGHLEAYASRTAMVRTILAAMKQGRKSSLSQLVPDPNPDDPSHVPIRSKALKAALDDGDELVREMLDDGARFLAAGLASIVNFYNPPRIILGGGLVDAVDHFFHRTAEQVPREALRVPAGDLKVVKAKLGDFSGIVGAAVLARQTALAAV